MTQDRTERETTTSVEGYAEAGLMPKVGLRLSRSWTKRSVELAAAASEAAGMTEEEFGDLALARPRLADAVWAAADRASVVDDSDYRDALARVLAVAADDARIDEAAYLLAQLVGMEPLHVRLLATAAVDSDGMVHRRDMAVTSQISDAIVASVMEGLVSVGMAQAARPDGATAISRVGRPAETEQWFITDWGMRAMDYIHPDAAPHR